MQTLAIAAGGAIGALARYWVSSAIYTFMGRGFPWGTLTVNIIGSLLMGALFVLFMERISFATEIRAAVLVGLLGAFTTFSTFSIETLYLMESGEYGKAGLNIVVSVTACILATWIGVVIARQL